MNYLKHNDKFWSKKYSAVNVESFVWRPFATIFDYELGITGKKHEKILDFGCGEGAAVHYLGKKGFDVYGVDISKNAIATANKIAPQANFKVIGAKPTTRPFFDVNYDVIISIQTLYYLNDTDWKILQKNLYDQLKPGGYVYFTMMGKKCWYYKNSKSAKDGLRHVKIDTKRLTEDIYISFIGSKKELIKKFNMFKPVHVGWYGGTFRSDEGEGFHWTYVGRKE